ncbi:MAG: DUF429 domain-containing protein, partial [Myxococcota bacterium]
MGGLPSCFAFSLKAYSGTEDVLADIVGSAGEWGGLAAVAIDAPLTWSGGESGWRDCDTQMRESAPDWLPKTWIRSPNALTGAVAIQGPALAWSLAQEIKGELLPRHPVVETHPRLGLAHVAPRDAVLAYRDQKLDAQRRADALSQLVRCFVDAGVVQLETDAPRNHAELDALVAAVVALGCAFPESGV